MILFPVCLIQLLETCRFIKVQEILEYRCARKCLLIDVICCLTKPLMCLELASRICVCETQPLLSLSNLKEKIYTKLFIF